MRRDNSEGKLTKEKPTPQLHRESALAVSVRTASLDPGIGWEIDMPGNRCGGYVRYGHLTLYE